MTYKDIDDATGAIRDRTPPHVQRMLIERYELAAKVIALGNFIDNGNGPIFQTLPGAERVDMNEQLLHMNSYLTVLERRIRRADPENTR